MKSPSNHHFPMVFPSALFDTAKIFAILVASKPRPKVIQGCRFPKMLAFQQTHRATPASPLFCSPNISYWMVRKLYIAPSPFHREYMGSMNIPKAPNCSLLTTGQSWTARRASRTPASVNAGDVGECRWLAFRLSPAVGLPQKTGGLVSKGDGRYREIIRLVNEIRVLWLVNSKILWSIKYHHKIGWSSLNSSP